MHQGGHPPLPQIMNARRCPAWAGYHPQPCFFVLLKSLNNSMKYLSILHSSRRLPNPQVLLNFFVSVNIVIETKIGVD
jgi:hypothetical protein